MGYRYGSMKILIYARESFKADSSKKRLLVDTFLKKIMVSVSQNSGIFMMPILKNIEQPEISLLFKNH